MKLDNVVSWYQKKISIYDKQQWEKTVEQRILNGFVHVPMKATELQTEFIDVDLVRGSTFPKAKPKQSLLTVLKFSLLRFLFLPIYAKWWVEQTSPRIFTFLLLLYLLQMLNWGVYSYNIHRILNDSEHIVSIIEFIIPMILSLILSMIHSQIVATKSINNNSTNKRNPFFLAKKKIRERVRRKRKQHNNNNKSLSSVTSSSMVQRSSNELKIPLNIVDSKCQLDNSCNFTLGTVYLRKPTIINLKNKENQILSGFTGNDDQQQRNPENIINNCEINNINSNKLNKTKNIDENFENNEENVILSVNSIKNNEKSLITPSKIEILAINNDKNDLFDDEDDDDDDDDDDVVVNKPEHHHMPIEENQLKTPSGLRRRNVNFNTNVIGGCDNLNTRNRRNNQQIITNAELGCDDDGFESFNGKSSSGEDNNNHSHHEHQRNFCRTTEPSATAAIASSSSQSAPVAAMSTSTPVNVDILLRSALRSKNNKFCVKNSDDDIDTTIITEQNTTTNTTTTINTTLDADCSNSFECSVNNECTNNSFTVQQQKRTVKLLCKNKIIESTDTDEEGDDGETVASSSNNNLNGQFATEVTTSATEWIGITTNSEDCSYSSEIDHSDSQYEYSENGGEYDYSPTVILNPCCGNGDRISCTIWEHNQIKKVEMSVLDISSAIIERVEGMPEPCDYLYIGIALSILLSLVPVFCRLCDATVNLTNSSDVNIFDIPGILLENSSFSTVQIAKLAFGMTTWEQIVLSVGFSLRISLTFLFFFLLAVAERTFKQRFLYAKLFSHLTSSRRARKSKVPHFRLNKVRNIKIWLSVRSYLKRRGPQRSVDVIVSAAFLLTLLFLGFLSVEWLKDSVHLQSQYNLEALTWSCCLGCFLLRFMTLGTKINRKYRSISVLITEQINLYLQIEQKPHKKDELVVANSVLKLAADLLKELESPFKISGLSANPYLYTTIKVVILSALSGVLSEMLGFKLKLHKIKIK